MKISFGANYIKSVNVVKTEGGVSAPEKVSFVELDIKDKEDSKTLDEIADTWGDNSYMILAKNFIKLCSMTSKAKGHIYAVTSQKDSFEKLNKDKILGATVFVEGEEENKLALLQVNPKSKTGKNTYNKVGASIMRTLQDMYLTKPIKLMSSPAAVGFYEKLGFRPTGERLVYIWNA